MPTYSFRCETCDHKFDAFTSMSGQANVVCPECGGKVERVYHGQRLLGAKSSASGGNCSGNCTGCAGCNH